MNNKYNLKYFNENKVVVKENSYMQAYDLDGHRIGIWGNDRGTHYAVAVDGVTIATRARHSNTIRLALAYLNERS